MAEYRENIVDIDLKSGTVYRDFLNYAIGSGDEKANRYGVRVFRDGEPETLNGTCVGYFIRADKQTVVINEGVISGNVAYVELAKACYAINGPFSLAIKITGTNKSGTMRIIDGMVSRTTTDAIVDPGTLITDIDDLIEAIEDAIESVPPDYSDLVDAVKGSGFTDSDMTAGGYGTFLEIPYGDRLCYFSDPTAYGFPAELGNSFYLHVSDKANSDNYAYKTFYAYSNGGNSMFTVAGSSSTPINLPTWTGILNINSPVIAGKPIGDTELTNYGTFLAIPRGCYFTFLATPGAYGFPANAGQSFYLEVSGSKNDGSYKTFKIYGNNSFSAYAVASSSSSSSNLPKWIELDNGMTGLDTASMEAAGYTSFVDIPQGCYGVLLTEPGTYGFPVAIGQSFVLEVSYKKGSNYAYVKWAAYGNNGTAMYAVGGNSTSSERLPVWYYLTSSNGGGSVGGINKFQDPLGTVNLLLLGDSITQGAGASGLGDGTPFTTSLGTKMIWGTGNSWALKFIEYLEDEYPNIQVTNHGWGGISLNQLATYINEFVPEGTTHCIIGLGINSEGQSSFDGPIATIINYLLERNIEVFAWTSWLGTHPNLSNINTAGRVQAALMHAYRNVGIEPLPVYSIAKRYIDEEEIPFMDVMEWQPDDEIVHPNDLGHTILFRIIREGFGF